jgi:hypothetical protein
MVDKHTQSSSSPPLSLSLSLSLCYLREAALCPLSDVKAGEESINCKEEKNRETDRKVR